MASFSKFGSEIGGEMEEQLANLRKEVAAMKRALARQGERGYSAGHEQFAELFEELQERFSDLRPHLRRQARAASRMVQDNSTAVIAGAVILGLIGAFLFSRR